MVINDLLQSQQRVILDGNVFLSCFVQNRQVLKLKCVAVVTAVIKNAFYFVCLKDENLVVCRMMVLYCTLWEIEMHCTVTFPLGHISLKHLPTVLKYYFVNLENYSNLWVFVELPNILQSSKASATQEIITKKEFKASQNNSTHKKNPLQNKAKITLP